MGRDALSTRIGEKLAGLTPINAQEHCIFKVHKQLFEVNEKAYKPVLLAIGPYNDHGKVGQGLMEEHKQLYLKQMLQRRNETSVEPYISALTELEERARNCYAECISLRKDEFVEMMLLDGCFIIELFRKCWNSNLRDKHDPIFQMRWMRSEIARDLLLFENQLPFFVLAKLFEMSASDPTSLAGPSIHSGEHIVDIAISFFIDSVFQDWDFIGTYSTKMIKHLLCQTHTVITPPLAKMVHEHLKFGDKFKNADFKHLLDLIHTIIRLSILDIELHHATESQEVGVKFKKGEILNHLFGLIRKSGFKSNMAENSKHPDDELNNWIEHCNSIPYGIELQEAGVEFKMAEKFRDKFEENENWKSIPDDVIAFQDAGVEFDKAIKFRELVYQERPNEDGKSKLCGAKFKMIEKFMRLPFLNKIENWNSIPHSTEFKDAGVEFKKAKKFTDTKNMIRPIPNATELKEGGVKLKKAEQRTLFTKFSNGVLEISPLRIEDETETILRNLIAFEQYSPHDDSSYVTDYICLMDDLIDSPKDVELLRQKRIIENWLGDDEVASTMVNKLGHHLTVSNQNSIYAKTSLDLNKYCPKRWNERKAKLRHNYFHSPWALLSVLAAILLLALAITLTKAAT